MHLNTATMPHICAGERSSSGAASATLFRGVRSIGITLVSFIAAPEDGRTPAVVSRCALEGKRVWARHDEVYLILDFNFPSSEEN